MTYSTQQRQKLQFLSQFSREGRKAKKSVNWVINASVFFLKSVLISPSNSLDSFRCKIFITRVFQSKRHSYFFVKFVSPLKNSKNVPKA